MEIYKKLLVKGTEIFLSPKEEYTASEIVFGVYVNNGIKVQKMYAINSNTYRGFHRMDTALPGPKEIIYDYIGSHLPEMIKALKSMTSKEDLDYFAMIITEDLRDQLSANVMSHMLGSFNKVRKPVDLLLEHLVAMSSELSTCRKALVPLLNIPLDSHLFKSDVIFDEGARKELGITKRMSFQHIRSESQYQEIQTYLEEKAQDLSAVFGKDFYPIYFDLIWNDRYERGGKNLFETNP